MPRLFTNSYCALLAANFLMYFGFWLLIPLLPFYLQEMYGLDERMIGIILCGYTVSALMVRPFSGFLMDRFPRKPLYLLAYGLFCSIFVGYMFGVPLTLFILLRILHGLAFGAVTLGGNTLVVDVMPSARRGEGLGYYGLANNMAMSLGPMTGLFLHGHMSYALIFGIGMSACLLGWTLAGMVRAPRKQAVPATGTAANRGTAKPIGWDRFLLLRGIPAGISLILLSIPYGTTTNFVALYAEQIHLHVPSGFFFVILAAGMGISRLFAGRYVDRGRVTECIHCGFYLVVSAFLLLSTCALLVRYRPEAARIIFFVVPALQGIGFGIMFPAYNSLYINLAPHNRRATATSTYLTSWDFGIGTGILLGGMLARTHGFAAVYLCGGLLSLLSMLYFHKIVTPHYHRYKYPEGRKM